MLATAVVGHLDRMGAAGQLATTLGGRLYLDDGRMGEWRNHERAWVALSHAGEEWACLLQDDALPVPEIGSQLASALAVAPSPVVSLYLGTSYPESTVRPFTAAIARADRERASWVLAKRLFWGVGVAVRTELIPDMLRVARQLHSPYDQRLSYWAQQAGHRTSYCWPSLVDHADGATLIEGRKPRLLPRRAYRVGAVDRTARSVDLHPRK